MFIIHKFKYFIVLTMIQSYWHVLLLPQVTGCSRSKSSKVSETFLPGGAVMVQVQECRWAKLLG